MFTTLQLSNIQEQINHLLKHDWTVYAHAGLLVGMGFVAAFIVSTLVKKALKAHAPIHYSILIRRIAAYFILGLFFVLALERLGVDRTLLFGAAGIVTVGLGFAAQSAVTNLISGMMLIADKTFIPGEEIVIDKLLGEVLSIDLLSIKMRTKENALVRLPNETVLKSQVCNISRFPIRRFDMHFYVSFQEDIEKVKRILFAIAQKNPACLESPPPEFFFLEFGPAAIHLQFSVWGKTETFLKFKSDIQTEINQAFQAEGIVLPQQYTLPV